jgi:LacI family transcriptional regulator
MRRLHGIPRDHSMTQQKNLKRIALTFPIAVPWMAHCIRGIVEYAQERGGWNLFTSPPTLSSSQELSLTIGDLKGWPGDGVVAMITDPAECRDAQALGIPVVTVSGALENPGLPRVMSDQYAIGRLGAAHLLSCGFRNLAFYGLQSPWYAQERRRGFESRAKEAGIECAFFEETPHPQSPVSWQKRLRPLNRWLKSLKKPVGIMAVHDYRARVLLEECHFLNLNIPHQVAIIGVDNNSIVCENCQPTLSSISRNPWRTGYEAARILDQLMAGKRPEALEILVPPDGVALRRSTDTVAVDNAHVSTVARYMHDNLSKNLTVDYVLQQVPISRRLLEKLFRTHLGCSPHDYLCRLRVERAKDSLAAAPRRKVQTIAKECGFATPDRMRLVFRQLTGMNPTQYRQKLAAHKSEKVPLEGM